MLGEKLAGGTGREIGKHRSAGLSIHPIALGFALLALAAPLGCGDDGGTTPQAPAVVWGTVTLIETSPPRPVTTAEVVLVDPADFTVKAGPAHADSSGRYTIEEVADGTYVALVLHTGFLFFDRTRGTFTVAAGDTVRQDFRVMESVLFPTSGGFKVRGTVRELTTQKPLAGVFVQTLFSAYPGDRLAGVTLPYHDVTDASGAYELEAMDRIVNDQGIPVAIFPVDAAKEGYRVYHSGALPLPEGSDSTVTWNFTMAPDTSSGSIRGRVVHEGAPAAGIRVALDAQQSVFAKGSARGKALVPVAGKVAVTDSAGQYVFTGLRGDYYTIDAAFLPDDGFVTDAETYVQTVLHEGQQRVVPDLRILTGIAAIAPVPGSAATSPAIEYRWTAVAGVDRYRLWITSGTFFNTSVTVGDSARWAAPVSAGPALAPLEGAHMRWYVEGFRSDTLVAKSEVVATFTIGLAKSEGAAAAAR